MRQEEATGDAAASDAGLDELQPPSWERGSLVVMAIIVSVAAFTYLGPTLTPVLLAVFLFYMIRPAAEQLVQWKIPSKLAYPVLFAIVVVVFAKLIEVVYDNAVAFQADVPAFRARLLEKLNQLAGWAGTENERQSLADFFQISAGDAYDYAFGTAFGVLETSLLVFFYLLFIILNSSRLPGRVRRAFSDRSASHVLDIAHKINEGITRYIKVKTLVSLGMGIAAGLFMYLIGLQFWPLWAFLTFALNYITYVGSMVACVPPILVAFIQYDNPWWAMIVAAVVIVNRFLWIDFVEIRYSGKHLNIDSVLLLVSLAYFGRFWGVLGLVLAVPLLTSLKITLYHFEVTRRWAVLISEE